MRAKTFFISFFSPLLIEPASSPSSSIMIISSSDTSSALSFGSIPHSRSTAFIETVSSHITGFKTDDIPIISPLTARAMLSERFIALRLGTSSPRTSVK